MNGRKIVEEFHDKMKAEEPVYQGLDIDLAKHARLVEAITRLLENSDYKVFAAVMIGEKYDDDLAMLRKHHADPAKASYYAGRLDLLEALKDPTGFRDFLAQQIAMKKEQKKTKPKR